MQLLIYIIAFPILWLISLLPFRLLYIFSDIISFILFHFIVYRKKVVLDNLILAFPNKSEKELLKIRRQFYTHFTDVFMEMIKSITSETCAPCPLPPFTAATPQQSLFFNGLAKFEPQHSISFVAVRFCLSD